MHAEIKDGFDSLAKERAQLIKVLNDKGEIGTKRLESWLLFNTTCVIAEGYASNDRKKLKLEMAAGYLEKAKSEMEQYGIQHKDCLNIENALTAVIKTISKLTIGKYKSTVSEVRDGAVGSVVSPKLKK